MKLTLVAIVVFISSFAVTTFFVSRTHITPAPHATKLTQTELEAAKIEDAFSRALADTGSRTQAHSAISSAKFYCFGMDASYWDQDQGSRA